MAATFGERLNDLRGGVDAEDPGEAGFSGSLVIAEFASLDDVRDWADEDPYVAAGVYREAITLRPDVDVLGAAAGLSILEGSFFDGPVVSATDPAITTDRLLPTHPSRARFLLD